MKHKRKVSMLFILFLVSIDSLVYAVQNLEFTIIITSYNNEKYCEKNLETVVTQALSSLSSTFEVICINDCSKDRTKELMEKYVKEHKLEKIVKVVNNEKRLGALANIYNVVQSCPDHKIIIQVDGDDYLVPNALARVEKEYNNKNTWLTYGQYAYYPDGRKGICEKLPNRIMKKNAFRGYAWVTSHLRTFKAGLFKRIKKEDLMYKSEFYPMAWDLAMLFPMLEMASKGHIVFIPDIIYLYNYVNPLSDHNVNRELQVALEQNIRKKKPYTPLNSL